MISTHRSLSSVPMVVLWTVLAVTMTTDQRTDASASTAAKNQVLWLLCYRFIFASFFWPDGSYIWTLFINVFSSPIKSRAQCYASLQSNFHEHLLSHDAGKACHSLHIVWHELFFFSKCNKSYSTWFRFWYTFITFYLRCGCATFLSQCNEVWLAFLCG